MDRPNRRKFLEVAGSLAAGTLISASSNDVLAEEPIISDELSRTLNKEQQAFLIGLTDAFKKGGELAQKFNFLHPNLPELIKEMEPRQRLLQIGPSWYELRELSREPEGVRACTKICGPPWRCC
jgi:hypothetical protein